MLNLAILGAGFIGQMHALTFRDASMSSWQPKLDVTLKVLAEQNSSLADTVKTRYGFERQVEDWRSAVTAGDVDVFINAGPNHLHAEPCIVAAQAGRAVFCEKPLASTAEEASRLWQAVAATGVINMCALMYRSIPAINLARQMIRAGELAEIRHFRSRFLLNMLTGAPLSWRFSSSQAGLGAMGDLGSHHIDLARFLVGEVASVAAMTRTWSKDSAGRINDVNDDAFVCVPPYWRTVPPLPLRPRGWPQLTI
jgi:predicted dehydrogenase